LIDGRGQVRGADGYGWIARYLHGRQISYCAGDASQAYGDAGLTRFRRHLILLRPDTVVVYDDLAADHPAQWSWLLHSGQPITADADGGRLLAAVDKARAQVDLFGHTPLVTTISDRFDPPAVNWRDKSSGGKLLQYADQWHVAAVPNGRSKSARFLAVVRVAPDRQSAGFPTLLQESDDTFLAGGWRISATLDPDRPASLLIQRTDGGAALAMDRTALTVDGVPYPSSPGESVLVEDAGQIVLRCGDAPPH
jgi:hypothetical protein